MIPVVAFLVGLAIYGLLAGIAAWSLKAAYARPRSYLLLAIGFTLFALSGWAAWFLPLPSPARLLPLVGCLVACVPLSVTESMRRIGGLTTKGELWMLNLEVAEFWNKHRLSENPSPALKASALKRLARIEACRTDETADLVELLVLDYNDRLGRTVPSNILIARGVRIQEIRRRLYPKLAWKPKLSTDEATWRWHFRRALGRVQMSAVGGMRAAAKNEFGQLLESLDEYRRDDTSRLIDLVQQSGREWCAQDSSEPWAGNVRLSDLGPEVDRLFRQVCPCVEIFSGAVLEPEDEPLIWHRPAILQDEQAAS